MIREAIILAGGLGTRLKSVVADLPKSLAPVAHKPFLAYLLDYAGQQGIEKFIFALGYKTEQIETFVKEYLPAGSYDFSVEDQPLGTGGAIYNACSRISERHSIVLNADTFFAVPFSALAEMQYKYDALCTLALKPMTAFDRYGVVNIGAEHDVTGFSEKKWQQKGLINGGVYALSVQRFLQKSFPFVFSFEKDYLEKEYGRDKIRATVSDHYFIDIGIPEDYQRAQHELPGALSKALGK
jgi:D-glycero-alpha-D-manno-heptose 1-phosphate guanylyltransferase